MVSYEKADPDNRPAGWYLLEKRPQIAPNESFLLQLIRYENDLIQSREIKLNEKTNEENPTETLNEFENKHQTDN